MRLACAKAGGKARDLPLHVTSSDAAALKRTEVLHGPTVRAEEKVRHRAAGERARSENNDEVSLLYKSGALAALTGTNVSTKSRRLNVSHKVSPLSSTL